jgi:hypothetical protein
MLMRLLRRSLGAKYEVGGVLDYLLPASASWSLIPDHRHGVCLQVAVQAPGMMRIQP